MRLLVSYIKILRIGNSIMASGAVLLGAWISDATLRKMDLISLAFAAFLSAGFGNIINDIIDIETDRISHPKRPLPSGSINRKSAFMYGSCCAMASLLLSFSVAPLYGLGTLFPLLLLVVYALYFKGTPLYGNIMVSLLVAYALLFGSIEATHFSRLLLPAVLAVLLNFSREIIKDLQDEKGDRIAGMVTSASLPHSLLNKIIVSTSVVYAVLLLITATTGTFGNGYIITIVTTIVPLHIVRLTLFIKNKGHSGYERIAILIKLEMLSGLAALALDKITFLLLHQS